MNNGQRSFVRPELRKRMRLAHNAYVELTHVDHGITIGRLRDISLLGLYLYVDNMDLSLPMPKSVVTVQLRLESGQSSLVVDARAQVVRIDGQGMAVRFAHPLQWWPVFTVFPQYVTSPRMSTMSTGFAGRPDEGIALSQRGVIVS